LKSWFGIRGAELLDTLAESSTNDSAVEVRAIALELLAKADPMAAAKPLLSALRRGSLMEQQAALRAAQTLSTNQATPLLEAAVQLAIANELTPGAWLELTEALTSKNELELLEKFRGSRHIDETQGVSVRFPELLTGGDAEKGRQIFFEKTEVSCVRCHAVGGLGGAVGPELSKIGSAKDRAYLLEAIIDPNIAIAEGFETQLILDIEGVTHFGIVKQETDDFVELMNADGQRLRVPQDEIEERRRGQSSMPTGLQEKLTSRELRDLVEYLTTRRE
jgi:quinoprotein glucose dehydrogenase